MSTSLREHLQKIYDERQQLTADDVVEEATDPEHPLHNRFEWDNSIAGPKFRRDQAKRLIRSCRIVSRDDTAPITMVRAFQHVTRSDGTPTYKPSEEVAMDPIAREVVRRTMRREWLALRNRYKHWVEFFEMIDEDLAAERAQAVAETPQPETEAS